MKIKKKNDLLISRELFFLKFCIISNFFLFFDVSDCFKDILPPSFNNKTKR